MDKIKNVLTRYILSPSKHTGLVGKVRNKPVRILLNCLVWAAALLFPLYCYLTVEYIHFSTVGVGRFHKFIQNRPTVVLGMVLMLYFIWAVLLLLLKKAAAANGILCVAAIILSVVNHFKYILTGDFFYPWDLVQTTNIGQLTGFVNAGFSAKYLLALFCLILLALIPVLAGASIPLKAYIRVPAALIIALCMFLTVRTPVKINQYLKSCGMARINAALQTSNYMDNGLIGGFTMNVLSMKVEQPSGYSEQTVHNCLQDYEYLEANDSFSAPDIIVILSESFWDPKLLPGSSFHDLEGNEINPIENFDSIANRTGAISGKMAGTALGGGTVRPEFEVLTGLSTDYLPYGSIPYQYLSHDIESYVSIYKQMGYTTYLAHPYLPAFYSRDTGYPHIGISNLNFENEVYDYANSTDWNWDYRGKYISDHSFMEYIEHLLDDNTETPSFVMGISMEAHQPYESKFTEADLEIIAENSSLDESTLLAFRNYTMAMYDADRALGELVDYIDSREKDTIVIYFGDHLPMLGTNYAAYLQSGLISSSDRDTAEDRRATQFTPFLIYANFPLSDSVLLQEGSDNEIASYNLLNAVSELVGSPRTAFMQFLTDFGLSYPAYNARMNTTMTDELKHFTDIHKMITYDRIVGKLYSMKNN